MEGFISEDLGSYLMTPTLIYVNFSSPPLQTCTESDPLSRPSKTIVETDVTTRHVKRPSSQIRSQPFSQKFRQTTINFKKVGLKEVSTSPTSVTIVSSSQSSEVDVLCSNPTAGPSRQESVLPNSTLNESMKASPTPGPSTSFKKSKFYWKKPETAILRRVYLENYRDPNFFKMAELIVSEIGKDKDGKDRVTKHQVINKINKMKKKGDNPNADPTTTLPRPLAYRHRTQRVKKGVKKSSNPTPIVNHYTHHNPGPCCYDL